MRGFSPNSFARAHFVLALRASFAIFVGYFVMGVAWGILAYGADFSFAQTLFSAVVIFSGSLQFLLLSMLALGASMGEMLLASMLLNSRYFFYVLSIKSQLDSMSRWRKYLATWCINDESFATVCARKYPANAAFFIIVLAYIYWIFSCCVGYLLASLLRGDYSSYGFSSKALFIVLAYELVIKCRSAFVLALAFLACAFSWVLVPEKFMLLAAVIGSLAVLLLAHKRGRI